MSSLPESPDDKEEPDSRHEISRAAPISTESITKEEPQQSADKGGLLSWIRSGFKSRPENNFRETLEEFIEDTQSSNSQDSDSISPHEKMLIANILKLRDLKACDAMIPRADIIALDVSVSQEEMMERLASSQFSRLPVYKDNIDDVLGTIHIKDVLAVLARGETIDIRALIREVPVIAPSMSALNLLLQMRETKRHMAMVVDEFGGIDGLVTMGDVIEEIVGQVEDEHDTDTPPQLIAKPDGTFLADARLDLETFEERFGNILSLEEREENDTLGGLMFYLAGRVPVRGEVLTHDTGIIFEVTEADPRRVKCLRIRNISAKH